MVRRVLFPLLTLLAAAAALAACGGEDDAGGAVASVADDAAPAAEADDTTSGEENVDRHEAELRYARCMREHGVDMPDPKPGEPLTLRARKGEAGTVEEAQEACRSHLEGIVAELSPQAREQIREAGLKFARCMREHGIDVPDPSPEGEVRVRVGPGTGIDPEDPAFRKAHEACEGIMRAASPGAESGAPHRESREDGER